eukprot:6544451-Prymnesium_polylepis.1
MAACLHCPSDAGCTPASVRNLLRGSSSVIVTYPFQESSRQSSAGRKFSEILSLRALRRLSSGPTSSRSSIATLGAPASRLAIDDLSRRGDADDDAAGEHQ